VGGPTLKHSFSGLAGIGRTGKGRRF